MASEVSNFGRNIRFRPLERHVPKSVDDVLAIMKANAGRRFRAIGRLHSWSDIVRTDEVLLDLKELNSVETVEIDGLQCVKVGGGCQIKRVIVALDVEQLALPSQGLITEQTVAGAISSGTHGSGKSSLSHYVVAITVAIFDPESGEPTIKTISEGPELLAARCSLGCMGIILSVTLPCRPQYNVEEHFRFYGKLDDVLVSERDFPIQQFFLLPHCWAFMAQHRKATVARRSWLARAYRIYWFLGVDLALHLLLLVMTRVLYSRRLIRFFFRRIVPLTIFRGWRVVDKSHRMLTMEHELFRHIEIEVFVKRSRLNATLQFVRSFLAYGDGNSSALDEATWNQLRALDLDSDVKAFMGSYTHHYPICVRKVEADDTLISMASGAEEACYAVSFINYNRPDEREAFFQFASLLARTTSRLFDARPHWGKVCPIDGSMAERLYPRLPEFRQICNANDPDGAFRNAWIDTVVFNQSSPEPGGR